MSKTETNDSEHPFDVATDNDKRVNKLLADTDGKIAEMQYTGTIGYHVHVAEGETSPEYLWKIALLQAMDETVFEMAHVDADDPAEARQQLWPYIRESFDPMTADYVADQFEENLRNLIETQEEFDG